MRGPPGVVGGEILLDAHFGSCGFVAANADFIEFGALPGRLHRCGQVYITVRAMYQVVSIPSRESALLRPSGLVGDGRGQYRLSVTKIHRGPPPVRRAAGRSAPHRRAGATTRRSRGGQVRPRAAHVANDRIVSRRVLIVRGQARRVGSGDRRRRTPCGARAAEPPPPDLAQGQPPLEQGPLHRRGHLRRRVGAGDGGQPVLTRARPWRYHRRWVGRHRRAPVAP